MPITLLPQDDDRTLIIFGLGGPDLLVSESHESVVTITTHPVEKGSNVSDHIRVEHKVFSFESFVTQTPTIRDTNLGRGDHSSVQVDFPEYRPPLELSPGSIFRGIINAGAFLLDLVLWGQPPPARTIDVLTFPQPFDRIREVQTQLTALQEAGTLFTVISDSRTYTDMLISRIGIPKDQPGGATVQVEMQELKTVETATVKAPKPLEKRGAPKVAKGSQGVKDAADVKPTSLAKKALDLLGV